MLERRHPARVPPTPANCAPELPATPRPSRPVSCSAPSATKAIELAGIPFNERSGLIRNEHGRVTDVAGNHLHGESTAGWIKRGPSGVIGTNKKCAIDTVNELLHDVTTSHLGKPCDADPATIDALLRERVPGLVDWAGWQAIDAVETAAGEPQGRPRVKRVTYESLADAAEAAIPSAS